MHPGFIISYYFLILLMVNPYLFGFNSMKETGLILIYVIIISVVFPLIPIVMMYALGFTSSITLKERKERIVPLALTGMFYLWLYVNMIHNPKIPVAFNIFILGSVISVFLCFFLNLFDKISLHMAGIGGLFVGLILMHYKFSYDTFDVDIFNTSYYFPTNLIIFVVLLLLGLVGTSRLYLKAHESKEIYAGLAVGILSQIIALRVLM